MPEAATPSATVVGDSERVRTARRPRFARRPRTFLSLPTVADGVLRTVRDAGPTVLVPLAWLVVAAAHRGLVSDHALLVAHVVMAAFIAGFAVTGWSEMDDGALRAWRAVLVVGLGVTLSGIAGFLLPSEPLRAVSIVGWMLLPAAGLLYTGYLFTAARTVYFGAGWLSVGGAVVYTTSLGGDGLLALVGIALVGAGQTVGIVDAAMRDDREQ